MKQIPLTKGKFALVDDADYEWLSTFNWHVSNSGYAYRYLPRNGCKMPRKRSMQEMLLPRVDGKFIDHINRDRLDNRRLNLRLVTRSENNRNRISMSNSGILGVCRNAGSSSWVAQASFDGRNHYIGSFKTIEEAAKARTDFLEAVQADKNLLTQRLERKLRRGNSSGFSCVHKNGHGCWVAIIQREGKRHYVATCNTPEKAHQRLTEFLARTGYETTR